jgi:hypothetical protein
VSLGNSQLTLSYTLPTSLKWSYSASLWVMNWSNSQCHQIRSLWTPVLTSL